jgi:hypothetical protein
VRGEEEKNPVLSEGHDSDGFKSFPVFVVGLLLPTS